MINYDYWSILWSDTKKLGRKREVKTLSDHVYIRDWSNTVLQEQLSGACLACCSCTCRGKAKCFCRMSEKPNCWLKICRLFLQTIFVRNFLGAVKQSIIGFITKTPHFKPHSAGPVLSSFYKSRSTYDTWIQVQSSYTKCLPVIESIFIVKIADELFTKAWPWRWRFSRNKCFQHRQHRQPVK